MNIHAYMTMLPVNHNWRMLNHAGVSSRVFHTVLPGMAASLLYAMSELSWAIIG
jgi:hypothetical protein